MFKRKQKRSQWMEGVLLAEELVRNSGIDSAKRCVAITPNYLKHFPRHIGFIQYLNHYENNLKNILC